MYVVYRKIKKVALFTSFIGFSMHLLSLTQNRAGIIVRVASTLSCHPDMAEVGDVVELIADDVDEDVVFF